MWNLEEEKVNSLKEVFKIDRNIPSKKALFEFINPKLSSLLDLDKEEDYEELFYNLVEKLAEIYEIEKFKIYSYNELKDLVLEKLQMEEKKEEGVMDKIIEKVDLLSIFGKEDIIKQVGKILL